MQIESEITLDAPRTAVFNYLAHGEHLPEYVTDFAWGRPVSEGEPGGAGERRPRGGTPAVPPRAGAQAKYRSSSGARVASATASSHAGQYQRSSSGVSHAACRGGSPAAPRWRAPQSASRRSGAASSAPALVSSYV